MLTEPWRVAGAGVLAVLLVLLGAGIRHGPEAMEPVTQLLETYECTKCHRLTTPHRLIGPSLWKIGERADAASIRASILTPDAVVTPGYPSGVMRACLQANGFYADVQRRPAILERLVAFLAGKYEVPREKRPAVPPLPAGMVTVPAGRVQQPGGNTVKVPAFAIDAAPVTYAQYGAFIAAGGYTHKRYWDRVGWMVVVKRRHRTRPRHWPARAAPAQPVVGVTWYEADAYCRWQGKSLPTAAQWQRACLSIPGWYGAGGQAGGHWEWTAEAVWKGGPMHPGELAERCALRVPSYPALDSLHTGFRCAIPALP